jgi:hypothetical protein
MVPSGAQQSALQPPSSLSYLVIEGMLGGICCACHVHVTLPLHGWLQSRWRSAGTATQPRPGSPSPPSVPVPRPAPTSKPPRRQSKPTTVPPPAALPAPPQLPQAKKRGGSKAAVDKQQAAKLIKSSHRLPNSRGADPVVKQSSHQGCVTRESVTGATHECEALPAQCDSRVDAFGGSELVCWFCHSCVPQLLHLLCCWVGAVSQVSWVENAGNVGDHPSNTVGACTLSCQVSTRKPSMSGPHAAAEGCAACQAHTACRGLRRCEIWGSCLNVLYQQFIG